ncbi:MAG: DUF11 domain-containing protein [Ruminococcaceae bacterium]|nr:DUF11 domain-containing protein [Oscillospiraceae bacterium]
MAIIENFATVRYTSGGVTETAVSNLAEVTLESSVSLTKQSLGTTYEDGSLLTYILTVQNTSGAPLTNVRIEDDLGTFAFGSAELTPLTYGGNALLLINGQDATAQLTVDTAAPGSLIFIVPTLAAGAVANIVYNAQVNEYAPLEENASVVNTATLSADAECAAGSASATVTAENGANVSVFKQMSPNPVVCGDTLTYTIRVYNYGNTAAENVRLSDAFDPAPANITVLRNGVAVPATEYTYEAGVLTVPADTSDGDTVPAATFTRDSNTGVVSVVPGMVEYTVIGTI